MARACPRPRAVPDPDAGPAAGRLVWLFDVDGTLLLTDGASREAFSHALRVVLGIDDDLSEVPFLGRTEPLIVADILSRHGAQLSPDVEPRFWNVLFDHMRRLLVAPRGRMMPGVRSEERRVGKEARLRWARH